MPFRIVYSPGANSLSVTFKTHLNYIKCMARLTDGLAINTNIVANSVLDTAIFAKFEKLSEITKISINGEKDACDREKAYAQVASPWIPVKCYYRLYYLESVFLYLLNNSRVGFSKGGHTKVRKSIKDHLKNQEISFSGTYSTDLATIIDWGTASNFVARVGSTISANYHSTTACSDSVRKKLAEYIEIDWKQDNHISNYRTLAARVKKASELMPNEFSLIDYFYWMRIKANYRDVDFLDFENNVNEADAYEYLTYYIKAADQYAIALVAVISQIKRSRGM